MPHDIDRAWDKRETEVIWKATRAKEIKLQEEINGEII